MINRRISHGVERKQAFEIEVDGEKLKAYEGETIATVLMASGKKIFRKTNKRKMLRGLYCGIGQCQECKVTVNGVPNLLACQTFVAPGYKVITNTDCPEREGDTEWKS